MEFIGIPFSGGSLGKNFGCELAPPLILTGMKLDHTSLLINGGVKNFNIDEVGEVVYDFVKENNKKLFLVGGDHSITYFSFKAFAEQNKNVGLLVFDAHPDMQSSDFVTHEDYLRILIDKKLLNNFNLVIVGLRSISKEEFEYLKQKRIIYFDMNKIYELGVKEVCDIVMEKMSSFNELYLSIDIDVVDPAFAPGTGYLEPGGISSSDLLYFLSRIKNMKNLKIVDLVEINPKKDINNLTINLGKKVVGVFL